MAKEPGGPPGGNDIPSMADERADHWEATFFSPDGNRISEQSVTEAAEKPAETPSPSPVASAAAVSTKSDDPAYEKRIAREAFSDVEKHADDLGEALHAKFMQLLSAKVEEKNGHLTAEDVKEMGDEFKTNLEDIKTAFLDAVESYTLARERLRVESARHDHFTRLLMRKFEHRFRDERKLQNEPEFLSRRMIPGFSSMLSLMFGKPQLASYQKRINAVIERLKHENNGEINWGLFYRSPEIKKLTLRAEIEIAQNFKDANKRLAWMVAMINSNLIPAEDHWMGTEWTFNEEAARKMLGALFSDLRAALQNANARERIGESLGSDVLNTLETVATQFR